MVKLLPGCTPTQRIGRGQIVQSRMDRCLSPASQLAFAMRCCFDVDATTMDRTYVTFPARENMNIPGESPAHLVLAFLTNPNEKSEALPCLRKAASSDG